MKTLLIVDDEEINRVALQVGFSDSYQTILAEDGNEALDILKDYTSIDAILLDLNMPNMNGIQVLEILYQKNIVSKIPVFIVTVDTSDETLEKVFSLGCVDIIEKPYNLKILKKRVASQIEFFQQKDNLEKAVQEKTEEIKRYGFRLIESMADMVEFRSKESGLHVKRVRGFTKVLMEALIEAYPEYRYLKDDIENITFAACLHDIGKNAIPDYVLNKPDKLTTDEFAVMQTHTTRGYEQIIAMQDFMTPGLYKYSLDIVRHHHERFDGHGYPDGVSGDDISIWSQAVGLADSYDALTSERCYKKAFDHDVAVQMILNGECGGSFNPKIIKVFKDNEALLNSYRIAIQKQRSSDMKRILVIDDSDVDRDIMAHILKDDYEVIQVENAKMGLELINDSRQFFDAILIDVNMPHIDGFKAVEFLGRRFVKQVPVILMTSDAKSDYLARAASLGIADIFQKPFNPQIVLQTLETLTGNKIQENAS